MKLSIICPYSFKYSENIKKLCTKATVKDYDILDPKSYDLAKTFGPVMILGKPVLPKNFSAKVVWYADLPEDTLSATEKVAVFEEFKKCAGWLVSNHEEPIVLGQSIPDLKTLEKFFEEKRNQVIVLDQEDGKKIGLYPDGHALSGEYDYEFHASIIVNLARIKDIFNPKVITFKDL